MTRARLAGLLAAGLAAAAAAGGAATGQPFVTPQRPGAQLFLLEVVSGDAARTRAHLAALPTGAADVRSDTHIARGGVATPFVFLKGCRTGSAGRCRVTATFTLTGPAGAARAPVRLTAWTGPPPAPDTYARVRNAPAFRFSPRDPPGAYRLTVKGVDRVAGVSFTTSVPFTYG